MKIALIATGSQGDVQPLAALGSGLRRLAHEVKLVSHAPYAGLACECGLDFAAVPGNPMDIVQGEAGQSWLSSGGSSILFLRRFARIGRGIVDELTEGALEASRGTDAVVYGLPLAPIGFTIAELLGVPGIPTSLYPVHPTAAHAPVLAARLPLQAAFVNRISERAIVSAYCSLIRRLHGDWRRKAGLGRMPNLLRAFARADVPYLYGYSPSLLPPPADWGPREVVCGYWFLPPRGGWSPPRELGDFLAAGAPPVYVGFGSMPNADPERVTEIVVEALRRTGRRGVLSTGWGGLKNHGVTDSVLPVAGYIPHEWLFARVSAVVHHGGAGTTAMALRSGIPSVVVPFFADQFFWGALVHRLGVGARPVLRAQLSTDRLEAAIREIFEEPETTERARSIAERIRSEDGVAAGAAEIDRYLRSTARRTRS